MSETKIAFDKEHKRYEVSLLSKDGIVHSVSSDYRMCHNGSSTAAKIFMMGLKTFCNENVSFSKLNV